MSRSDNLQISNLWEHENVAHDAFNRATGEVASAIAGCKTITFHAADANAISLSDEDWVRNGAFWVRDEVAALVPENVITLPARPKKGRATFYNDSNNTLRITAASHSGDPQPEIHAKGTISVWYDGTNVRTIGGSEFVRSHHYPGTLGPNPTTLWAMVFPFTVWLRSNFGTGVTKNRGSFVIEGDISGSPSSDLTVVMSKNSSSSIGTAVLDKTTGGMKSLSIAEDWGFAWGDRFSVIAFAGTNWKGISMSFMGVR